MPYPFNLPELGYAYDALEPHIDARTMEIHHTKHHQAYTNNLNAALEGFESFQGYSAEQLLRGSKYSAEQLLRGSKSLPAALQGAVQNHGGGFHNHALFWEMISPGGADAPSGELAEAIDGAFGSFDAFKEEFTKAALGARLLPELPEPPSRLPGRNLERRELGRGCCQLRRGHGRLDRSGEVRPLGPPPWRIGIGPGPTLPGRCMKCARRVRADPRCGSALTPLPGGWHEILVSLESYVYS